jgi:hypothetical protein
VFLVRVFEDGTSRPLEDKTDWRRRRDMTLEEVRAAAVADPGAQILTEERLARMRPCRGEKASGAWSA